MLSVPASDQHLTVVSKDEKSIQAQAVEAVIYAPLGMALEVLDHLPGWVARGKSQITIGRFVGKMAAQKGQHELDSVLGDIFGIDRHETPTDDSNTELDNTRSAQPESANKPKRPNSKTKTDSKSKADSTNKARSEVSGLALESYDTLTASQIVKRLDALSKAQLDAIATYESDHRHRVTILNRVRQIQRQ